MDRLKEQIQFLLEIDRLKTICRKNYILRGDRRENVAEHSWHLAVMVMVLAEHATAPFDALKAMKMVLIHDLVEIDAGDTFVYDEAGHHDKYQRERAAAERIFRVLPDDQFRELLALWEEFEARETPEARFALAVDRFHPILQNYFSQNEARTWRDHGINRDEVLEVNAGIEGGSDALWEYVKELIDQATAKGYLED